MSDMSRHETAARRLAMIAGTGAYRVPAGGPDTSGQAWKPYDVAHALSWIRGRRREYLGLGEHDALPEDEERDCRLTELLLTALYVDLGGPGFNTGHLFVHLVTRAVEIADLDRADPDYPMAQRLAGLVITELSEPQLCKECEGHGTVPEWRWQQLQNFKAPDRTRMRPVSCPKCGGNGLKPRADRPRYEKLRTDRRTYQRRWKRIYEDLLGLCLVRLRDGTDAVCEAMMRQAG